MVEGGDTFSLFTVAVKILSRRSRDRKPDVAARDLSSRFTDLSSGASDFTARGDDFVA